MEKSTGFLVFLSKNVGNGYGRSGIMCRKDENDHRFVILSEGQSPKSKDLRTDLTAAVSAMRRSFDSLCSLRMTDWDGYTDSPSMFVSEGRSAERS